MSEVTAELVKWRGPPAQLTGTGRAVPAREVNGGWFWVGGLHGLGSEKSSSCRTGVLLAVGQMWESHRLAVHGGSSEGRL